MTSEAIGWFKQEGVDALKKSIANSFQGATVQEVEDHAKDRIPALLLYGTRKDGAEGAHEFDLQVFLTFFAADIIRLYGLSPEDRASAIRNFPRRLRESDTNGSIDWSNWAQNSRTPIGGLRTEFLP